VAFFFAADFFLPPFLVPADLSECWTGLIPLLGMFLAPLRNAPAKAGGEFQGDGKPNALDLAIFISLSTA
jgi:hypothetical protein